MDLARLGSSLRALRRRRGWTQTELAIRCGASRSAISRIERGEADRFTLAMLARLAASLDARLAIRALWHGEELDRLLDAAHAALVDATLRLLSDRGWECAVEVTFALAGERGSIDVLAWHAATGSLLVVEVKSVVPDLQATLGPLDRKVRLARRIGADRGWTATTISRLLVLPDDRTARRRIVRLETTFASVLPARTVEVRRWLGRPVGALAGVLFLSDVNLGRTRHRVAPRGARPPNATGPHDRRIPTSGAGVRDRRTNASVVGT